MYGIRITLFAQCALCHLALMARFSCMILTLFVNIVLKQDEAKSALHVAKPLLFLILLLLEA
jgi:hypothetical protein